MIPGDPITLLACRYSGLNQAQSNGSLAGSALLPAAEAASELNATRIHRPGTPPVHCPNGDGEHYLLRFAYRDRHPLDVSVTNDGCYAVDNGDLVAVNPPSSLITHLETGLGKDLLPGTAG
jgi:hypothetical protein